jgi:predicted DNA-binding protein (MmcQ/YjbR family)
MVKPPALFERQGLERFIGTLPAATLVRQWGDSSVAKIGDKIFATFNDADGRPTLAFKCSEISFELLTGLDGVRPAPYLARASWVSVDATAPLTPKELAGYLTEAHRLVAARLTRGQRAALGLEPIAAARDTP